MGNRLRYHKNNNRLTPQELVELGETARKERDALLKKRPKLKAYQNEIDRRLAKAGNTENRMAVLGIMIEANLRDLQQHLSRISSIANRLSGS